MGDEFFLEWLDGAWKRWFTGAEGLRWRLPELLLLCSEWLSVLRGSTSKLAGGFLVRRRDVDLVTSSILRDSTIRLIYGRYAAWRGGGKCRFALRLGVLVVGAQTTTSNRRL